MDLEWFCALISIALLPILPAIAGIVFGHWSSVFFMASRFPDVSYPPLLWQLELVFFIGLLSSAAILIRLKRSNNLSKIWCFLILAIPVFLIVGFGVLNLHNIYVLIYTAASIIIAVLAVTKSKYMAFQFWSLYLSWIIGYLVFVTLIWVMGLDPNTQFLPGEFFIKFCIVPFPVYLLELILAGHIWTGFISN